MVVNISSGAGLTPIAEAQVYSATKGAVDNLTRSLALELGPRGIRVVGIAPGLTATEGNSGMGEEMQAPFIARTPLGRIGQPADIAAAVSFVVSADGGWITGETLQVGGGLAALACVRRARSRARPVMVMLESDPACPSQPRMVATGAAVTVSTLTCRWGQGSWRQ